MNWTVSCKMLVVLIATYSFLGVSSESSSEVFPRQVHSLIQSLAKTHPSSLDKKEEAQLWRRLGKLQLDAGEFAEARRIFCRGSEFCPLDAGLRHHVRVWDAFHAEKTSSPVIDARSSSPPPRLITPIDSDIFLSLNVPVDAIPQSIKNWKGRVPPPERVRLVHASRDPVLSREACQFLMDAALETVEKRGWTKDRHVQAPTCDVPVFDLPLAARIWCRDAFETVLFPLLASTVAPELDIDSNDLRILDCFVVRYDADGPGFMDLRPHQDESLLSLTIALNDMDEYEGGGLFISSTGDLLNGNAGTVLCFAGGLVHGGYPITKGTRWILTVFLYVDANESGKQPGYTLRAIRKEATATNYTK